MENTDTSAYPIPSKTDKNVDLYIASVIKIEAKGYTLYKFTFEPKDELESFSIRFFKNQLGDIFRALGFEEYEPNKFNWEIENAEGQWISAMIDHQAGKDGVIRPCLLNVKKCDNAPKPETWEDKETI